MQMFDAKYPVAECSFKFENWSFNGSRAKTYADILLLHNAHAYEILTATGKEFLACINNSKAVLLVSF